MFSMVLPRDYISSPVVEREREWDESSAAKEDGFGLRLIVSNSNWLWLRVIVKEPVNKSNHPILNPLLLVTEPRTRDNIKTELNM
jgi:hypothetical protein